MYFGEFTPTFESISESVYILINPIKRCVHKRRSRRRIFYSTKSVLFIRNTLSSWDSHDILQHWIWLRLSFILAPHAQSPKSHNNLLRCLAVLLIYLSVKPESDGPPASQLLLLTSAATNLVPDCQLANNTVSMVCLFSDTVIQLTPWPIFRQPLGEFGHLAHVR